MSPPTFGDHPFLDKIKKSGIFKGQIGHVSMLWKRIMIGPWLGTLRKTQLQALDWADFPSDRLIIFPYCLFSHRFPASYVNVLHTGIILSHRFLTPLLSRTIMFSIKSPV
ncbi:hypothetical protein AP3564_15485 [Aeribacillus pallidus]|uniref:Uncharacterized protein n=1 Tax=Aeribacillus pallidus TaxID=33936 RepID=A0A223E8A8_9BACI|nr:hypothetical protein AP3564_15485 [Aeribacillus pallidus]